MEETAYETIPSFCQVAGSAALSVCDDVGRAFIWSAWTWSNYKECVV